MLLVLTSGTECRLNLMKTARKRLPSTRMREALKDGARGCCSTLCGGPCAKRMGGTCAALLELMPWAPRGL